VRQWLPVLLVALLAAAAGIGYQQWRMKASPEPGATQALTAARFPDLAGQAQGLEQWRGKVLVVNFWATWCAPCREEIPAFVKLQEKYGAKGLQFVGIAIDQASKVQPFASEFGMNFPVLIGSADAIELTRRLGNKAGVLPFTVILTRDGRVAATEIGAAKEARLEPFLASLL
jgi:thiol-disulfide isomerase/thioredoxin